MWWGAHSSINVRPCAGERIEGASGRLSITTGVSGSKRPTVGTNSDGTSTESIANTIKNYLVQYISRKYHSWSSSKIFLLIAEVVSVFPEFSRSVDEIFFGLGINFYAEGFFSYALFFRASPPPGAMVSGVMRMVFLFMLLDSLFMHTWLIFMPTWLFPMRTWLFLMRAWLFLMLSPLPPPPLPPF